MPGSRKPDPRFVLHGQQPRADKLSLRQRGIARIDPAFAEALRQRVSDPGRWAAFILARPQYSGKACPRCGSTLRRTRDRSCYACLLRKTQPAMAAIKAGQRPPATRSRDSHLDLLARRGSPLRTYRRGNWTATVGGTGHTTLRNPALSIDCQDLRHSASDEPDYWYRLAQRDTDLQRLLVQDLGW